MTSSITRIPTAASAAPLHSTAPPAWAVDLLGSRQSPASRQSSDGIELAVAQTDHLSLVTARVPNATALDPAAFQQQTVQTYQSIAQTLGALPACNPVRFWNHIPSIHAPARDGRDRYMVFNAGRFQAFSMWYGSVPALQRQVATASGIGHDGTDLIVHCLAARQPGVTVDNPRQIAPCHYSRRFGPRPPCFARATVLAPWIFVGGTASIRGEESVYIGDLPNQARETFANMAGLIHHACGGRGPAPESNQSVWLAHFRELRIYMPNPSDVQIVLGMIKESFPAVRQVEQIRADLCRSELLVEIEGLAEI